MDDWGFFTRVDVASLVLGGGFELRLQDVHVRRFFVETSSDHGADADSGGRCASLDAKVGLGCVRGVTT